MTLAIDRDVTTLRATVDGPVLLPGDEGYDEARAVWNGDIDRRPAVIARCTGPDDVAAALRYAQDAGLEVAVRGGGHGYWGAAVPEGGMMIDLSPIDHVVVDPEARRARVGGGATLGQLDAASQDHGLAVPAGTVSHTGVGGLTLGGGWGWLSRLHGLTIDNLESAEVVLADGRRVRANESEHPDLLWALRGGGGNFGVVTEFEFRLHEVGPLVQFAMLFVEQDRAASALRAARDLVDGLGRTVSPGIACVFAPPAPFVPPEHHFAPVVALILVGFGTAKEHAAAVATARAAMRPLFEVVTPMPYVALQQMLDEGVPWGTRAYTKGLYLDELPDPAIDLLAERLPRRRSGHSQVLLFPFGGGAHRGRRGGRKRVRGKPVAAIRDRDRVHGRRRGDLRPRPAVGPRYVERASPDRYSRRGLRQPDGRVRGRQPAQHLRSGQVRPAPGDQGAVRPDERSSGTTPTSRPPEV
jgi:FAD/FMN-containing dehydrogenase